MIFKCHECNQVFSQKGGLKNHISRHHEGGLEKIKCKLCAKVFINKHELRNHLRKHTGEKPYKCNNCPKSFTQQANLNLHYKIHAGLREHNCEYCPRSFIQKVNLQNHVKRKHSLAIKETLQIGLLSLPKDWPSLVVEKAGEVSSTIEPTSIVAKENFEEPDQNCVTEEGAEENQENEVVFRVSPVFEYYVQTDDITKKGTEEDQNNEVDIDKTLENNIEIQPTGFLSSTTNMSGSNSIDLQKLNDGISLLGDENDRLKKKIIDLEELNKNLDADYKHKSEENEKNKKEIKKLKEKLFAEMNKNKMFNEKMEENQSWIQKCWDNLQSRLEK